MDRSSTRHPGRRHESPLSWPQAQERPAWDKPQPFWVNTGDRPPVRSDRFEPSYQDDQWVVERYFLIKDRFTEEQMNWWLLTVPYGWRWHIWAAYELPRRKEARSKKFREAVDAINQSFDNMGKAVEKAMVAFTEGFQEWLQGFKT